MVVKVCYRHLLFFDSRVHALEEKVERLTANLTVLTRNNPLTPSVQLSTESQAHSTTYMTPLLPQALPSVPNQDGTAEGHVFDIIDQGLVTLDEAESAVQTFKGSSFPQFPFVVLDPGITAGSLRVENPFLFLTIVAANMFHNPPLQQRLETEIRKMMCSKIIMRAERNLGLLQGLLVHLAWYHNFFQPQAPQLFLVLQLCLTIIHELGIDKRTKDRNNKFNEGTGISELIETPNSTSMAAEKRALLGMYCLSSS
jgi:hypothetical protein